MKETAQSKTLLRLLEHIMPGSASILSAYMVFLEKPIGARQKAVL